MVLVRETTSRRGLYPGEPSSEMEISEKDMLVEFERTENWVGLAGAEEGLGKMYIDESAKSKSGDGWGWVKKADSVEGA